MKDHVTYLPVVKTRIQTQQKNDTIHDKNGMVTKLATRQQAQLIHDTSQELPSN